MLVVANQLTLRVSGKGSFAGAGKAKEQSRGAICANVGRAVHRANALLRHHIIHVAEAGFFHLAGIGSAANQNLLAGEIQDDKGLRVCFVQLRDSFKSRRANQSNLRLKASQLLLSWAAQQLVNKQILPSIFVNHPHRNPIILVRTNVTVENENIAALQISLLTAAQSNKSFWVKGLVDFAPIHSVLGGSVLHHKTILR